MKKLRNIGLLIIMVLFLKFEIIYAQNSEENYSKGISNYAKDQKSFNEKINESGKLIDLEYKPIGKEGRRLQKKTLKKGLIYIFNSKKTTRSQKLKMGRQMLAFDKNRTDERVQVYLDFLVEAIIDGGIEEFMDLNRKEHTPTAIGEYAFVASDFKGYSSSDFEKIKTPKVIPYLIKALNAPDLDNPKIPNISGRNVARQQVPVALAKLRAYESIEPLKDVYKNHHDFHLRKNAVYALASLLDDEKTEELKDEIFTDFTDDAEVYKLAYYKFAFAKGLILKGDAKGIDLFEYDDFENEKSTNTNIFGTINKAVDAIRATEGFKSQKLENYYTKILNHSYLQDILKFDKEKIGAKNPPKASKVDHDFGQVTTRILKLYENILDQIILNRFDNLLFILRDIAAESYNGTVAKHQFSNVGLDANDVFQKMIKNGWFELVDPSNGRLTKNLDEIKQGMSKTFGNDFSKILFILQQSHKNKTKEIFNRKIQAMDDVDQYLLRDK